ncbi:hypothetical protein EVAR_29198_1 [Eumeta japonica]|uniref:Uncharacterized protein n=1 Tax=Eumeta variegata TaxID=151549 RepID=A0A4C1VCS1_EUMVA|nr:hypothetical protein EVAR_29198_1 [Eumeta japonica]
MIVYNHICDSLPCAPRTHHKADPSPHFRSQGNISHTATNEERFFDIASSHPNPLLISAVSYEPPPQHHFCRRPRNVLLDPTDDLTAEVETLIEVNKMAID